MNFEEDLESFSLLGYRPISSTVKDPVLKVKVLFLEGNGPTIELVSPIDQSKHLDIWLQQKCRTYHYAYQVNDIDTAVKSFVQSGCVIVQAPLPAVAFDGRAVCFLMLKNRVLIELIQNE